MKRKKEETSKARSAFFEKNASFPSMKIYFWLLQTELRGADRRHCDSEALVGGRGAPTFVIDDEAVHAPMVRPTHCRCGARARVLRYGVTSRACATKRYMWWL